VTTLVLGQRMRRLDDGRQGVVALVGGERRISYEDRGETFIAPKGERWIEADPPGAPLRAEEKLEIALHADRALRAIDRHEPMRFWERPRLSDPPHDPELVLAILSYLSSRA
jgi:hypothetical protein